MHVFDPKSAAYQRAWSYGMTVPQMQEFFEEHGWRCGICGTLADPTKRGLGLVIDHDHKCCTITSPRERAATRNWGRPRTCGRCNRGLLCVACNAGIGQFQDDSERLIAALAYLGVKVEPSQ